MKARDLFTDESGFTTTSMVLSLLVTLALVFTTAQVYRINSASAAIQDVADAAALAAENQVAEFMVVARFCDAVVLSLSLSGLTATGLGLAALCTPVTAPASKVLIEAGAKLIKQRDRFAKRAARVLNRFQTALPFFAAAAAAGVSAANNADVSGASYLGAAVLVPSEGVKLLPEVSDKASELLDDIDEQADEIREKAKRAEEAAQEAERSKERAFKRDCGDNPSYCMYERASSLAGLSGGDNPLYTSVDAWSFSVALKRAKKYYSARYLNEAPANYTLEEQARSALRVKFYAYAVEELKAGYVNETADSFSANFPHLPSNTAEMRLTSLYTDAVYPVTSEEVESDSDDDETVTVYTMHAWPGCPEAAATLERGSIQQMEEGGYETCPTCGFTAASLGKVAAASTSVSNGFEYHYEAVADETAVYEKAKLEANQPADEVRSQVGDLFEELLEAAREAAAMRISPEPPGRHGAVAFVVNASQTDPAGASSTFGAFVSGSESLGLRAAVSASTLVDEGSDEGRTVINSMLDGLRESGGAIAGAAGIVLDIWSWMLTAYGDGQQALLSGVSSGLDALPLASASGLGTWASEKLEDLISSVGLEPAEVGALKPVLVNSAHVASKGEGSFSSGYLSMKRIVASHPLMSGDLFSSVLTDAEQTALHQIDAVDDSIEIASIELVEGSGVSIPITIPIPAEVKGWAASSVSDLVGRLRAYHAETAEVRIWE